MTCAIHQFRWKLYYIVPYENKLHVTTWLAFGVEHDSFTLVFRQDCRTGVSLAVPSSIAGRREMKCIPCIVLFTNLHLCIKIVIIIYIHFKVGNKTELK